MSDSYGLTVIFEKDINEDFVDMLIQAIRMMKGVRDVKPLITTPELYAAKERAKWELEDKLWKALRK